MRNLEILPPFYPRHVLPPSRPPYGKVTGAGRVMFVYWPLFIVSENPQLFSDQCSYQHVSKRFALSESRGQPATGFCYGAVMDR